MLHPKYKLSYFRAKKWPEEWVKAAKTVLREQWLTNYNANNSSEPSSQSSSSVSCFSSPTPLCINLTLTFRVVQEAARDSLFSSLDDFGTDDLSDELEEYLNMPTISTKGLDPLMWWHAIGDSPLARMAIDFLSAPGKFYSHFLVT